MKYTYRIEGMQCASCIEKIRLALSNQKISAITLNPPQLQIEAAFPPGLAALNKQLATAGRYQLHPLDQTIIPATLEKKYPKLRAYYPIYLIMAYIIGIATFNSFSGGVFHGQHWMNLFMAGFFLVFSAFKLLDLKGFADSYASYDLLARHFHWYGLIYPFLELLLGILYLGFWFPSFTLWSTVILMGFSSLGVINSLLRKRQIQCACLGTALKIPLSSITLIEDLLMVALAGLGLLMKM